MVYMCITSTLLKTSSHDFRPSFPHQFPDGLTPVFIMQKFMAEAIGWEIEKHTRSIYPLQNVYVHKAKILKAPKFDMSKLLELHGEFHPPCRSKGELVCDSPLDIAMFIEVQLE